MRPISPGLGGEEHTFAEDQLEFAPCVATRIPAEGTTPEGWLLRYTFTADERRRIANGEDITLWMLGGVVPHSLRLFNDSVRQA